jgi:hypothetical protein
MMGIKAITTHYKGYKFRSRLEARWAVYFDSLGIKWEYELEGFEFKDGTKYLPDFWLPEIKMFAEVKAIELNEKEKYKCEILAKESGHGVFMLIGVPERKAYYAIYCDVDVIGEPMKDSSGETGYMCQGDFVEYPGEELKYSFYNNNFALSNYHNYPSNEGRFYSAFDDAEIYEHEFDDIDKHITKARSARFEHGENGE